MAMLQWPWGAGGVGVTMHGSWSDSVVIRHWELARYCVACD